MEGVLCYLTPSSRGLGHRPFTAVTPVQIWLGSPIYLIEGSKMKYLQYLNDLAPGRKTYKLQTNLNRIDLLAYRYDTTSTSANPMQSRHINAMMRAYFLRKGFLMAVAQADPRILKPIYQDMKGNEVAPPSLFATARPPSLTRTGKNFITSKLR